MFIAERSKTHLFKLQTKALCVKQVRDHLVDFNEMVVIGSGGKKKHAKLQTKPLRLKQVSEHLVEVNEVFIAGRGKKKNAKLQTKPLRLKQVGDHPVDFNEMVVIGSGGKRKMPKIQIRLEEEFLTHQHGEDYLVYKQKVRRFI